MHVCACVQGKVTHQSNAVRPAHAHSRAQKVRDETIVGVSESERDERINAHRYECVSLTALSYYI